MFNNRDNNRNNNRDNNKENRDPVRNNRQAENAEDNLMGVQIERAMANPPYRGFSDSENRGFRRY
ncbi:MAG: hypothetical protein KTV77_05150 [Wolbachia endosymbiont of Fragariocoptes setiger]|nr:hypothetical protein [Wolbachia endosymbiont of Fragariocoptes setiger]